MLTLTATPETPLDLAALRAEVQRKAAALAGVPREQLAAQFLQLVEDLRADARAKGSATDDEAEWVKDD